MIALFAFLLSLFFSGGTEPGERGQGAQCDEDAPETCEPPPPPPRHIFIDVAPEGCGKPGDGC